MDLISRNRRGLVGCGCNRVVAARGYVLGFAAMYAANVRRMISEIGAPVSADRQFNQSLASWLTITITDRKSVV